MLKHDLECGGPPKVKYEILAISSAATHIITSWEKAVDASTRCSTMLEEIVGQADLRCELVIVLEVVVKLSWP
jgi:hypothetical protein